MEYTEISRADYTNEQLTGQLDFDVQTMSNLPAHAYLDGQPCCCPGCFSFDL